MEKLNKIHTALIGEEEYETNDNGGLVGKAKRNAKGISDLYIEVDSLSKWRIRTTAIYGTISIILSAFITFLTIRWQEIWNLIKQHN